MLTETDKEKEKTLTHTNKPFVIWWLHNTFEVAKRNLYLDLDLESECEPDRDLDLDDSDSELLDLDLDLKQIKTH